MKRRVIFFLFQNRYRYTHTNNLFGERSSSKVYLMPIVGKLTEYLQPAIAFLHKLGLVEVVYTDDEFGKAKSGFRIFWNDNREFREITFESSPLFLMKSVSEKSSTCQFYPVISRKTQVQDFRKNRFQVVYVAEVERPKDKVVLDAWLRFKHDLLDDFKLITQKDFWEINFPAYDRFLISGIYSGLSNLIRLECISCLRDYGVGLDLRGSQWRSYGFASADFNYSFIERRRLYRGSVCLDFGAKSGTNSLYQRTIEIIESGGLLLQVTRSDSVDIFGAELSNRINFSNLSELCNLVSTISNNPTLFTETIVMLQQRFLINHNLSDLAPRSIAALFSKR
jgi:hypothetical protein